MRHQAFIYDRGGRRRKWEILNLSEVKWNRQRDATSNASVTLSRDSAGDQEEILREIEPGRHELCIFRDGERTWEGPLSLGSFPTTQVTFSAKDVSYYWAKTVMHHNWDSSYKKGVRPHGDFVTTRAFNILMGELNRKEALGYNLLDFIHNHHISTDSHVTRKTLKYSATVFTELDYMAANNGMDYTVIGRDVHLWDTNEPAMGFVQQVTEKDFLGELEVSVYGSELATRAYVTDGKGRAGYAGPASDPYYGEWEVLNTPFASTTTTATAKDPTQQVMREQARRNLAGRNPTPLLVRIPDSTSINPSGVLNPTNLVPGVYVPLLAQLGIRPISQMQKLSKMEVTETSAGETVTVTFGPATRDDLATAEGDTGDGGDS
jgi:hypothetical protein